jgi:hypothetical protein
MKNIEKVLARIHEHTHALQVLQEQVVQYARQQAETEQRYDTLLLQVHHTIEWLNQLQVGQVIDARWIAERDRLVKETCRLLPQGEPENILP